MTLHQLLTEYAKKNGSSDEDIEAAHAFSSAIVALVGGDDKEVAQTELTPEEERACREYIAAADSKLRN